MNGIEAVETNLLDKYPVCIPFAAAAAMLGYKTVGAGYTAKCRGSFPLAAGRVGAGLAIKTSDLINFLRSGERSAAGGGEGSKKSAGRPTKKEQIEAARRGLTVRELRAQQPKIGRV